MGAARLLPARPRPYTARPCWPAPRRLGYRDILVDPNVRACYRLGHFLLLHGPHGQGFAGRLANQGSAPAGARTGSARRHGEALADFSLPWVPQYVAYAEQRRGKGFRELPQRFQRSQDMECCPIRADNDTVEFASCSFYNVYGRNFTALFLGSQQAQAAGQAGQQHVQQGREGGGSLGQEQARLGQEEAQQQEQRGAVSAAPAGAAGAGAGAAAAPAAAVAGALYGQQAAQRPDAGRRR
jgi:hypothetical protein